MNTNQTTAATPAKLRDGSWGARTAADAKVGDRITITTRAGKSWEAEVSSVVWTGDGVALVATRSLDRRPARSSRRHGPDAGAAAPVRGYSSYCTDNDWCECFDCAS